MLSVGQIRGDRTLQKRREVTTIKTGMVASQCGETGVWMRWCMQRAPKTAAPVLSYDLANIYKDICKQPHTVMQFFCCFLYLYFILQQKFRERGLKNHSPNFQNVGSII